ncbi:hypothetical protein ACS125_15285 [Acinetobacter sp. PFS20]|uniref:hypothetical protein n=1 Tax=Acinetobacter sp. PFS20 TaxID=3458434 RepID=UPI003FD433E9
MALTWSLEKLERELNSLYEEIIALEDFKLLSDNTGKIAAMFLTKAETFFRVNYSRSGYGLVYSYYFQHKNFAEINLLQCPEFEEREQYIKWFVNHIRLGRENINLPS